MTENLKLIQPDMSMQAEFEEFCNDFPCQANSIHGIGSMDSSKPFAEQVTDCHNHAQGKNLPDGWVISSTHWMIDSQNTIIATMSIRHALNDKLEHEGGHIGYSVRPSYRGRGLGHMVLKLGLDYTRQLGLKKVLVCCDKENLASAAVIKHNGGLLANEVQGKYFITGTVQRYWIDL